MQYKYSMASLIAICGATEELIWDCIEMGRITVAGGLDMHDMYTNKEGMLYIRDYVARINSETATTREIPEDEVPWDIRFGHGKLLNTLMELNKKETEE